MLASFFGKLFFGGVCLFVCFFKLLACFHALIQMLFYSHVPGVIEIHSGSIYWEVRKSPNAEMIGGNLLSKDCDLLAYI